MKTSSAKAKGRRLQNKVRDLLVAAFPSLEPDDVKPAVMGESGKDIHLSPAAQKLIPIDIECKNQEKLNIWSSLEQAEGNTSKNRVPAVIFKRNKSDIYICISFANFLSLIANKKTN